MFNQVLMLYFIEDVINQLIGKEISYSSMLLRHKRLDRVLKEE